MTKKSTPPPLARPVAGYTGALLALVVVLAGLVGVQEVLTTQGWLDGRPWLRVVIDDANHTTASGWALPTGILAVVAGVLLVIAAVKPRSATHSAVPDTADAWISPSAVADLAGVATRRIPGVVTAHSRYTRGRIHVSVEADADKQLDSLEGEVRQRIAGALEGLSHIPVTVRSRQVTR